MKWKMALFFFIFQFICADLSGQNYPLVSIDQSNISVGEIIQEITRQTNINFTFNAKTIDTEKRISFSVRKQSLEKTLDKLCKKINLTFVLIEDQIVLNLVSDSKIKKEEYFTLSGFLTDHSSGETLIGATVAIPEISKGATSNAFGYYALQLKQGNYKIQCSYLGYAGKEINLDFKTDKKQNITLEPQSISLPNVIVGLPVKSIIDKNPEHLNLPPRSLSNMPEFAGESGLVKGLQSLPGLKMHSDGSAFFYARGGDRDQNLIIIDDAPIYNPSHLFGFYSIVIPDFAKQIKVYTSDVPTHLGDRLSSIVSIRTKDGNLNKFQFRGAVNPLMYRFSTEIPIVKKRGSLFISLRRSNLEWLFRRSMPNAELNFGDFNFKWNHKLNDNNRLFFTTIWSADNFANYGQSVRWGNFTATLRWNHIFGPKLFSNTTIYTGNYVYKFSFSNSFWQSSLGTLSAKTDFTHYTNPNFESKFGFETQAFFINPGVFSIDTSIAILPEIKSNYSRKISAYYHGHLDISDKIKLNAGFRFINWANTGPARYYTFDENYQVKDTINVERGVYKDFIHLDPRLSLQYKLNATSGLKFSYGIYHQYLQLISNSLSPFTSLEIWLPASENILPQASTQFALNYTKKFQKQKLEFNGAIYYKKFKNQIDYVDHANPLLNPFIEGELRFGSMRSYGLELFLKKDFGRLNGWINYTFSKAIRKTKDLNNGNPYLAFQDRPHDFSILINYNLTKRILCSAYWTAYSGSTFSSPTGFYTFNDNTVPIFDKKNNDRLPAYQRFDLAVKFRLNKKDDARFQNSLTFSIYNLFARKNIVVVNFNKIPVDGARPVIPSNLFSDSPLSATQTHLARFFPSLTYKFKI